MTPQQYRTELDRTHAEAVATLVAVLRVLPPVPSPRQWARFTAVLLAYILQARDAARDLAVAFYTATHTPPTAALKPLLYDEKAVTHLLARVVQPRLAAGAPPQVVANAATMAVQRHIDMAARNTTMQLVQAESTPIGWARVLTGRENCAFCIVLASRGPVYSSQKSAGGMDAWHDGCDCLAVPVFNRKAWPGRDTYLYAQDVYRAAPGKPSVANVRRYLDSLDESSNSSAA